MGWNRFSRDRAATGHDSNLLLYQYPKQHWCSADGPGPSAPPFRFSVGLPAPITSCRETERPGEHSRDSAVAVNDPPALTVGVPPPGRVITDFVTYQRHFVASVTGD